jgi:hypothetical protein
MRRPNPEKEVVDVAGFGLGRARFGPGRFPDLQVPGAEA